MPDDGEGIDNAHPLWGVEAKDRAKVQRDYVNLAKDLDLAVSPDAAGAIWVRAFRDIGNGCMSMPELVGRELAGYPEAEIRRFVKDAKASVDKVMKACAGWRPSKADRSDMQAFWERIVRDLKGHRPEMVERFVKMLGLEVPAILKSASDYQRNAFKEMMSPRRRREQDEDEVFEKVDEA